MGLNFGQLLLGDALNAKKELSRIFVARYGKKVNDLEVLDNNGRRVLKDTEVNDYRNEAHALYDSGAVPKILYMSLADRLSAIPEIMNTQINEANGVK